MSRLAFPYEELLAPGKKYRIRMVPKDDGDLVRDAIATEREPFCQANPSVRSAFFFGQPFYSASLSMRSAYLISESFYLSDLYFSSGPTFRLTFCPLLLSSPELYLSELASASSDVILFYLGPRQSSNHKLLT